MSTKKEEDISSTEEHQLQKTVTIRRKKTGLFAKRQSSSSQAFIPLQTPDPEHRPVKDVPNLMTFRELLSDTRCGPIKLSTPDDEDSSSSSSSSSSVLVPRSEHDLQAQHEKAFHVIPWQQKLLQARLEALPQPMYYPRELTMQMSHDQMLSTLRQRQQYLPLLTATLEDALLQEAGVFGGRDFPACVNGERCESFRWCCRVQGSEKIIPELNNSNSYKGFACTSIMFQEEYDAFIADGTIPNCRRPCVLCARVTLCDFVMLMRSQKCTTAADDDITTTSTGGGLVLLVTRQPVYQLYRNLVDCEEGYFMHSVLLPKPEEAIIDPVVRPCISAMVLERDTTTGRRRYKQNAIRWKAPEQSQPRIGESVSHF